MEDNSKRYNLFENVLNQGECLISDHCKYKNFDNSYMDVHDKSNKFNLHMLLNTKSVIRNIDVSLHTLYENSDIDIMLCDNSEHDSFYELSCIGIEYCSLLVFVITLTGIVTHYMDKKQIEPMVDSILEKAAEYLNILKQSCSNEITIDADTYIHSRAKDYEHIYYGDFEPCDYCFLKDYPRFKDNQLQDGLMRCCIALGDFSIHLIKLHQRANFDNIIPAVVISIFEMPFYNTVFTTITDSIFAYFNLSLGISMEYKEVIEYKEGNVPRYWDLASPTPITPTTKISESPVKKGTLATIVVITSVIIVLAILLTVCFS